MADGSLPPTLPTAGNPDGGLPLSAMVALRAPLATEGVALAAGALGTVVDILGGGRVHAVEFTTPRACVVTVPAELLVAQAA